MAIYVYRCDCGHRFERLVRRDAAPPPCPSCGGDTRKVPAGPRLGGRATPRGAARGGGPASGGVPIPWQGVQAGGPEKMQREVEFRQRLEANAVRESDPGSTPAD